MDKDIDTCIYIYKKKNLKINIMDKDIWNIYIKKKDTQRHRAPSHTNLQTDGRRTRWPTRIWTRS